MSFQQRFRAQVDQFIEHYPGFKTISQDAAVRIQDAILAQGEDARNIADILHGKQVGHPLHPILTDVTIGSWTFGVLFDLLGLFTRSRYSRKAANRLIAIGTLTAVPTAIAGMTDFSGIKRDAAGHGAAHGLLNTLALFLFWRSVRARSRGSQLAGIFYSALGLALMTLSAWLGGDLVYNRRVGVSHLPNKEVADDWTPILTADELEANKPQRVEVEGYPVLLYKYGLTITAITAQCSHAGGPLEEGKFENGCVQCPWHNSVFDLHDGHVVHGPATIDQPHFQIRVTEGIVEIRRWRPELDENTIATAFVSSKNGQAV